MRLKGMREREREGGEGGEGGEEEEEDCMRCGWQWERWMDTLLHILCCVSRNICVRLSLDVRVFMGGYLLDGDSGRLGLLCNIDFDDVGVGFL